MNSEQALHPALYYEAGHQPSSDQARRTHSRTGLISPSRPLNMGKKKRGHPDAEEILARPWCYYCERDFDDLKILISHQKAKHFKCERCGRRLNTAGGLSVHMNQVHKETLTSVENALPNRSNLDVEIFGMEGIPEDVIATHNQRVLGQFQQAEAERRAATGNPAAGSASASGAKKPKFESPSEIKKRLAEHKAKMAEQAAGGSSGGVTPVGAGQASHSPGPFQQAGSPSYLQQQPPFGGAAPNATYSSYPQPYEQPAYQPQQPQTIQSPPLQQYPMPVPQYPPPQHNPAGGPNFPQSFQGGGLPYGGPSAPVPYPQIHQQPPQIGSLPQRPPSLPPAAPGLPQRPSFGAPSVNAFQMQQLHQGQVLPQAAQPPSGHAPGVRPVSAANGSANWNGQNASVGAPQSESLGVGDEGPQRLGPTGEATSLDDLVAGAVRNADKTEPKASENNGDKKAKKDKDKDKANKLVYSDDKVSPEEKMANLPRYAFVPYKKEDIVLEDATTAAVAGVVVGPDDVLDRQG